jgi:hypothetical protein
MSERAQVTSIEAVEAFRSQLIIYLKKARPVVDEIAEDVRRVRIWLQNDQLKHWQKESRRCRREWEQAQQELFSAKMSSLRGATAAQQLTVSRAKRALENAEEKLQLVQKWNRQFDNRTDPLVKQLGPLQSNLARDMRQAVAFLAQVIGILEAYAETVPTVPTVTAPHPASDDRQNETNRQAESPPAETAPPSSVNPERITANKSA